MANNTNNIRTGVIDIPGALRPLGGADASTNQVGGVVAYSGDIYDVTAGKNQATLNAEFAEGITNASSSSFSGNYNDLSDIPLLKTAENGFKVNAHGKRKNTASEQDSFAEGAGTTASGQGSHSEGGGTTASGTRSHAEGNNASAVGNSSHAEGYYTTALGSNSHAEGNGAYAYGNNTHAEGLQETLLSLTTRAYTANSGTLYIDTEIFPGCVIYDTDNTPRRVLSCEYQETGDDYKVIFQGIDEDLEIGDEVYVGFCAYGENSHTEGHDTHTCGESSHAEGVHTVTTNEAEHASGIYNMSTANKTLFSVGAGHDGGRMNAFEIDTSGNVYIYGVGGYNGTNVTSNSVSDLASTITALLNNNSGISDVRVKSTSAGNYTTVVASGIANIDLSGFVGQVDDGGTALTTKGSASYLPRAIGLGSVSSGDETVAFGRTSTAVGLGTIAIGDSSFVAGRNSFRYSEFAVFNTTTYLQDGYIGIAYSGPYEIIPGMVMVFRDENYLISEYEPITNVEYGPYDGANTNWSGRDCLKLYYDTSHTIDVPTYLEVSTASLGRNSICLGYSTVAANEGEVAVGCCNITHGGLTNAEKTMFSVGIGVDCILDYTSDEVFRNAFEVMWDGSIYVKGVGGYDGRELTGKTDLATAITNINTRLLTLENSSSSSSSSYITYSEGEGYSLGDTTTASGEDSFAEGYDTLASGESAHAEGDRTLAYNNNSHAEGSRTSAFGHNSHAEGGGYTTGPLELSTSSEYYYDSNDDILYIFIDSLSSDSDYLNLPVGTVAAVATENTKILQYADDYSYISDKLYFVGPVDYERPVIAIKNIPPHVSVGGTVHSLAPIVDNENYTTGFGYKFTDTIYINFLTGTALGYASHSGGYLTNAVGEKSNTAGIRTVATNDGESSFGRYNVSEDGTIFSIGCGEWDDQTLYNNSHNYGRNESLTGIKAGLNKYTTSKNALMVNEDGDVFIKGIGGYDGIDSTAQGVKSVQEVIAELTQQIAALTSN